MGLINQGEAVLVGPVRWPDLLVVGNIITHIVLWRVVEWTNPNCIDPEAFDVVQFGGDTFYVTPAIVIRVFKTCGVDLIDRGFFPPFGFRFRVFRRNSHFCTRFGYVRLSQYLLYII